MENNINEFDPTAGQFNAPRDTQDQDPEPKREVPPATPRVTPTAPKALEFASSSEVRDYKIPGVTEKNLAGVALSDEALKVKAKLAKEPRIQTFVPLDSGERPGAYRSVTINGYRCEVKKGKLVSLPQSIATLLLKSMEIEMDTLNNDERNLANADEGTRRALGL